MPKPAQNISTTNAGIKKAEIFDSSLFFIIKLMIFGLRREFPLQNNSYVENVAFLGMRMYVCVYVYVTLSYMYSIPESIFISTFCEARKKE